MRRYGLLFLAAGLNGLAVHVADLTTTETLYFIPAFFGSGWAAADVGRQLDAGR